jgi:hypothetical protein
MIDGCGRRGAYKAAQRAAEAHPGLVMVQLIQSCTVAGMVAGTRSGRRGSAIHTTRATRIPRYKGHSVERVC